MFKDEREQNRFVLAFIIAWLINFLLGLFALAFSTVMIVNAVYAIGGGQWAPADESSAAFLRGLSLYAPSTALFAALGTLVSLFLAKFLAAKYPRHHISAYAFAGAVVPFAVGLITLSINWIGALIGMLALWPAARLLRAREPQI